MRNERRLLNTNPNGSTDEPTYVYEADVLWADRVASSGHSYTAVVLAAAVARYQGNIRSYSSQGIFHDGTQVRGGESPDENSASHLVESVTFEGGVLRVRARTLPTPEGRRLAQALQTMRRSGPAGAAKLYGAPDYGTLDENGVELTTIVVVEDDNPSTATIARFDFIPRGIL